MSDLSPADEKLVRYVNTADPDSEPVLLSVRDVMENDGVYCGPEWGWITLGELVEHGFGIDTGAESWTLEGSGMELKAALAEYWLSHPELAEDGEYEQIS